MTKKRSMNTLHNDSQETSTLLPLCLIHSHVEMKLPTKNLDERKTKRVYYLQAAAYLGSTLGRLKFHKSRQRL